MIGDPRRIETISRRLQSARAGRFEPVTGDPSILSWSSLRQQNISAIVVNAGHEQAVSAALLDCKLRGMPVISDLVFQERHLGRIDLDALTASDIVFSEGYTELWVSRIMKRGCDLTVSLLLIVLTLPLMCLTAVAIKADTPGPVFYRQQRIGKSGQPFTLFKFRSMTVDAEAGGRPLWAQKADPRVTVVGAFIRATRIDELPQLANVILGQMSLVGPRPERPHFVSQLTDAIPFYADRHYVKPGVTGWAQVNYPYGASVEDAREKLAYDLYYVKHRGILLDLLILLSTVRVVLFREGAR
jgi:sugar transferase (PEP-CTERM system associated)